MNRTPIEWCRTYAVDGTFTEGYSVNPVRFRPHGSARLVTMCQKVSPGCAHCYAESITRRFWPKDAQRVLVPSHPDYGRIMAASVFPGYTAAGVSAEAGEFVLDDKTLLSVLKTREPGKVFWGDMTDIFGEWVKDEWLDRIFAVCALTPHLTHIFLTKRPERMQAYLSATQHRSAIAHEANAFMRSNKSAANSDALADVFLWRRHEHGEIGEYANYLSGISDRCWPLPNVWLGVSVENQEQADKRIPLLLQALAAVRFISAEPLLGSVKLLWAQVSGGKPLGGGPQVNVLRPWEVPESLPKLDWVIVGGESGAGARPMQAEWALSLRDQCQAAGVAFFFKQWGRWAEAHFPGTKGSRFLGEREWNEFPEVRA